MGGIKMKESKFQLINHRLVSVDYNLNQKFKNDNEPLSLEIGYQTSYKMNKEKNKALVNFTLRVFNPESIENAPFTVVTVHEGEFAWDDSVPEDMVNQMLKINAPAILLSYDRSIISQLTTYSDMPSLIIPLIDFTAENITPPGEPIDKH
jgi:preprotein translocase subunit SecB